MHSVATISIVACLRMSSKEKSAGDRNWWRLYLIFLFLPELPSQLPLIKKGVIGSLRASIQILQGTCCSSFDSLTFFSNEARLRSAEACCSTGPPFLRCKCGQLPSSKRAVVLEALFSSSNMKDRGIDEICSLRARIGKAAGCLPRQSRRRAARAENVCLQKFSLKMESDQRLGEKLPPGNGDWKS